MERELCTRGSAADADEGDEAGFDRKSRWTVGSREGEDGLYSGTWSE